MKSINFYKPLTKTNQKLLFKTEDQLFAFRKIIDELGIDSDIQKALNALSNIYIPVGKKNLIKKIKFLKIKQEVPTWSNKEIKSYSEINSATEEQINFYNYFKENFLKGKYIHLKGNSNYAYILHYHLLEDYLKHRDGELLDGQLKALDEFCYKKLKVYIHSQIQYIKRRDESRSFGSDSCNLGTRYKNKLKFNEQEIEWLNKFESPSNVFISIEECCIAVIKQFLLVLKELNLRLWKKGTSIVKETTYLKEGIKKYCEDKFDPYWGYCNKRYLDYFAVHLVYLTIFERVENSVRVVYQQRGKLKDDFFYPPVNIEFENRIGNVLNQVIDLLKDNIEKPDISTQIKLNTRFVNSWDSEFKKLTNSFSANKTKDFINGISLIRTSNKKDPKIVNVLFEASTFIAKYNKVVALQYYAKYIFDNVKKKKFNNKQITKKSQKL
nr:hypothetical protein [Candidatus Cloacimonadota bacterium]